MKPSMNQPCGPTHDEIEALQLTCDRLRQQVQFQSAFLGTASHELRAPINQIISLHQLILEDLCESPAEEREFIAQANQAMVTVLRNLDTLISVSKLEIGAIRPQWQPVQLGPLLAAVQQLTEMKCVNRQCRLTVAAVDPAVMVQTDGQWLQQLLIILIDAALGTGSQQINIYLDTAAPDIVTLYLDCDCPLAHGQDPELGSSPAATGEAIPLSPSFSYQIAARMATQIQAALRQESSADQNTSQIVLGLPKAE
ncbi:MAG TPA: HAMP domain-containing histidine kinase [Leptolyngbyaceae cyanobacterium M65_K2018_010]|nr:HAMP domain-containing histidine kinase [Leptolyngbyaceae cyanobacterium M65_K2018_010]